MAQPEKILWYFADPMCSWCWGFSPVISQIVNTYRGILPVSLVVGGLRTGQTEPLSANLRDEILHHWRDVSALTGQPFTFDGALPEGFVYDTEPACRAAVTTPELSQSATFPYFRRLQSAFYVDQRDITQTSVLGDLAVETGLDEDAFLQAWRSSNMIAKTQRHFLMTREFGVRGFPTAVLQDQNGYRLLTNGYRPFAELSAVINEWLETPPDD